VTHFGHTLQPLTISLVFCTDCNCFICVSGISRLLQQSSQQCVNACISALKVSYIKDHRMTQLTQVLL